MTLPLQHSAQKPTCRQQTAIKIPTKKKSFYAKSRGKLMMVASVWKPFKWGNYASLEGSEKKSFFFFISSLDFQLAPLLADEPLVPPAGGQDHDSKCPGSLSKVANAPISTYLGNDAIFW